jgi:Na+(H+)/acetate symporter ActP
VSRVDEAAARPLPVRPGLWAALRAATVDFYYHSIRLVVANLIWGAAFFIVWSLTVAGAPLLGLVVAPLLALPWVGVVRLGALIVRGDDVVLSDAFGAYRSYFVPALAAGVVTTAVFGVLGSNVVSGLLSGGPIGWVLATLAGWGIAIGVAVSLAFWPLLVDPRRAGQSLVASARLAALVVLANPLRMGGLGLIVVLVGIAGTVAAAAIATFALAWISLAACRVALPLADRLEEGGAAAG